MFSMCWCPLMLPSQWSDIWLNQIPTDLKGTGVHLRRADRQAIWRQVDSIMLWQRDLQCDRQVGLVFFHADRCYWAREADRPVKGSFTVHPSLFSKWCLCDGPEGVCDFHISLAFEFITVLAMDGVGGGRGVCAGSAGLYSLLHQHPNNLQQSIITLGSQYMWCFICRKGMIFLDGCCL